MVSNENLATIQKFMLRLKEDKFSFMLEECLKESWNDNSKNKTQFDDYEKKQFRECFSKYTSIMKGINLTESQNK